MARSLSRESAAPRTRRGGSSGTGRRRAAASARSRARRRSRRRGPARPGRRRRRRRPAARAATICGDHLPLGARARRVEDDQVERVVGTTRPAPARRDPARTSAPAGSSRAALAAARAVRPRSPTTRPDGPTASSRKRGEQPDPGVQVEGRLPRLRVEHARAPSRPARRGAPGCTCQKPSSATAKVRPVRRRTTARAGASKRQSSTCDDVVRAVLAHPAAAAGQRHVAAAGSASAGRPRHPAPASTSTSTSRPARRCSCSRTTSALSPRCRVERTCWKSQPPHRPGPAKRHGGVDPVGGGRQHLDRVGAPEAVALGAVRDLDDDPLPRQGVPHEHHSLLGR